MTGSAAIAEGSYQELLAGLVAGDRARCGLLVEGLLQDGVGLRALYADLFQRALYEVGERWETGRVSVAVEHVATAIVESLLAKLQPRLFAGGAREHTAVVACVADEYHSLGGRMVADLFELQGWRCHFLGASTPLEKLLRVIEEQSPEVIGLSLSIPFNLPSLLQSLAAVRAAFPSRHIIVGGQAFRWLPPGSLPPDPSVTLLGSGEELDRFLGAHAAG